MGISEVRTLLDATLAGLGTVQEVRLRTGRKSAVEEPNAARREQQVVTFKLLGPNGSADHEIKLAGDAPLLSTLRTHAALLAANLSLEQQ